MLIGTALIVVPEKRFIAAHIGAGIAFALSVNCNFMMLAVCGLLGPGWAFFHRHRSGPGLRAIGGLVAGFLGTYLALAIAIHLAFPGFDFLFETAAVRESLSLMTGQAANWFVPFLSHIQSVARIWDSIAIFVSHRGGDCVAMADAHDTHRAKAASGLCMQLSRGDELLCPDFPFWISRRMVLHSPLHRFFIPGCVLAFILIVGEAEYQGGRFWGIVAVCSAIAFIVVAWVVRPELPQVKVAENIWIWLAIAAIGTGAAVMIRRINFAAPVTVFCVTIFAFSFYQTGGSYEIQVARSPNNQQEWDIYRGAIFLQDFVNARIRPTQSVGFWYSNDQRDYWLNSIQSTYLWGYSRLSSTSPGRRGMPVVDDEFRSNVAGRDFIVLLGIDQAALEAGRTAIEAAHLAVKEIAETRFQGRGWGYSVMMLALHPAAFGPLLFNVPLSRLEPATMRPLQRIPLGCSNDISAAVELQSDRPTAGR